jgi:hypothetical protein
VAPLPSGLTAQRHKKTKPAGVAACGLFCGRHRNRAAPTYTALRLA